MPYAIWPSLTADTTTACAPFYLKGALSYRPGSKVWAAGHAPCFSFRTTILRASRRTPNPGLRPFWSGHARGASPTPSTVTKRARRARPFTDGNPTVHFCTIKQIKMHGCDGTIFVTPKFTLLQLLGCETSCTTGLKWRGPHPIVSGTLRPG